MYIEKLKEKFEAIEYVKDKVKNLRWDSYCCLYEATDWKNADQLQICTGLMVLGQFIENSKFSCKLPDKFLCRLGRILLHSFWMYPWATR
ncbi:hypothetical protein IDM32_21585 [Acinetobacter seifertii]|nr:hypothetical protein [Acinetobacter seifertii]